MNKLRSNIQLNLIGFGPHSEINILSSKIKEFNLESKIKILDGTKENIANAFAQSHYMIFPSSFEGFGIVILEAQASGVHCFVSKIFQISQIWDYGKRLNYVKEQDTGHRL